MKVGDKVRINAPTYRGDGKIGFILKQYTVPLQGEFDWSVFVSDIGAIPYKNSELIIIGCPCSVKNCLTHRSK